MKLTINTLEERKGFVHESVNYNARKYSTMRQGGSYTAKCLLINGTLEDGRDVYFFTPSCLIYHAKGLVNFAKLESTNGWFTNIEGQTKGHSNPFYYSGSTETPGVIEVVNEIIPSFKAGDTIDITFSIRRVCKKGISQLNRVRLTKKL